MNCKTTTKVDLSDPAVRRDLKVFNDKLNKIPIYLLWGFVSLGVSLLVMGLAGYVSFNAFKSIMGLYIFLTFVILLCLIAVGESRKERFERLMFDDPEDTEEMRQCLSKWHNWKIGGRRKTENQEPKYDDNGNRMQTGLRRFEKKNNNSINPMQFMIALAGVAMIIGLSPNPNGMFLLLLIASSPLFIFLYVEKRNKTTRKIDNFDPKVRQRRRELNAKLDKVPVYLFWGFVSLGVSQLALGLAGYVSFDTFELIMGSYICFVFVVLLCLIPFDERKEERINRLMFEQYEDTEEMSKCLSEWENYKNGDNSAT